MKTRTSVVAVVLGIASLGTGYALAGDVEGRAVGDAANDTHVAAAVEAGADTSEPGLPTSMSRSTNPVSVRAWAEQEARFAQNELDVRIRSGHIDPLAQGEIQRLRDKLDTSLEVISADGRVSAADRLAVSRIVRDTWEVLDRFERPAASESGISDAARGGGPSSSESRSGSSVAAEDTWICDVGTRC